MHAGNSAKTEHADNNSQHNECIGMYHYQVGDLCVFRHVTAIIQAQKSNLKP